MNKIKQVYSKLYRSFGKQGWWPLTMQGLEPKHHVGKPKTSNHQFEIIMGAILTQNTNWKNVEKALTNLSKNKLINKEKIINTEHKKLAELIKPSGYYNQKAERLKIIAEFLKQNKNPTRQQLLGVNGIGPETADSILLYAYQKPYFVIDAYTKRIFTRLGMGEKDYNQWQELFMNNLPKDTSIFNEYHALLVELGKNHCKTRPVCDECPISGICKTKQH
jgi:endonuclease III related protein